MTQGDYSDHLDATAAMLRSAGLDGARAAELDAAVDILTDDGMPTERAMDLMVAALKSPGPLEPQARHIVRLRRAMRDPGGGPDSSA